MYCSLIRLGLVKTHFYNIWVQGKILRPNHELTAFHELLANVLYGIMVVVSFELTHCVVYGAKLMWQAAERYRNAVWWIAYSGPMAVAINCLWPNRCKFIYPLPIHTYMLTYVLDPSAVECLSPKC